MSRGKVTAVVFVVEKTLSAMVNETPFRKWLILIILATIVPLVGGIFYFIVGISAYKAQSQKESQYTKSTCEILTAQYKTTTCSQLWQQATCYVPEWRVRHGGLKFVNANIESERTYDTIDRTQQEVNEYEVAIVSYCSNCIAGLSNTDVRGLF